MTERSVTVGRAGSTTATVSVRKEVGLTMGWRSERPMSLERAAPKRTRICAVTALTMVPWVEPTGT